MCCWDGLGKAITERSFCSYDCTHPGLREQDPGHNVSCRPGENESVQGNFWHHLKNEFPVEFLHPVCLFTSFFPSAHVHHCPLSFSFHSVSMLHQGVCMLVREYRKSKREHLPSLLGNHRQKGRKKVERKTCNQAREYGYDRLGGAGIDDYLCQGPKWLKASSLELSERIF